MAEHLSKQERLRNACQAPSHPHPPHFNAALRETMAERLRGCTPASCPVHPPLSFSCAQDLVCRQLKVTLGNADEGAPGEVASCFTVTLPF